MTIGEVARAAGIAPSAIRYYEAVGIVPRPPRKNGIRQYGSDAVDQFKVVRFCRAAGVPIKRLASLTVQRPGSTTRWDVWTKFLRTEIADLDLGIREAERKRRLLERAVVCRCEGNRDECTVLQTVDHMSAG